MADHYPFTRRAFLPDPGSSSFSVWDRLKDAVDLARWKQRRHGAGTQYIAALAVGNGARIRVEQRGRDRHHYEMAGPPNHIAQVARLARVVEP